MLRVPSTGLRSTPALLMGTASSPLLSPSAYQPVGGSPPPPPVRQPASERRRQACRDRQPSDDPDLLWDEGHERSEAGGRRIRNDVVLVRIGDSGAIDQKEHERPREPGRRHRGERS